MLTKFSLFQATALSVGHSYMLCKSGAQIWWIFPQLGFQFDLNAENHTANFHSSFKDTNLTKRDPNPN
jgi:hypothetical protein